MNQKTMAKNYSVIDVRASKGMTRGQSNEHLRNFTEKAYENKMTNNFDPTRERLNFEVTKGGVISPVDKKKSITRRVRENLLSRDIKNPNEGLDEKDLEKKGRRVVADIILQGSRARMLELAFGNQEVNTGRHADNSHLERKKDIEEWAKDMYNFVAQKFGEENIAAFVVHLDETNPHIHCTLLPVVDGKISWKKVFSGKDKYEGAKIWRSLHDDLAEVNRKWGLERGEDIYLTGARHRTTEEYHRFLRETGKELEKEIEEKLTKSDALDESYRKTNIKVKALTTMLSNLSTRISDAEASLNSLNEVLSQGSDNYAELNRQRERLIKELEALKVKYKEKDEMLRDTLKKLEEFSKTRALLEKQNKVLKEEIERNTSDVTESVFSKMKDFAFENLIGGLKTYREGIDKLLERMTPETRSHYGNLLENDYINLMAEQGVEVCAVATSLFLGYIDGATQFAETHGGGGGAPESGWGKNPNEDDDDWKRRCLAQALKMMMPAGSRKKSLKR